MKTCKKFASVLLALVMLLALGTTAFAAKVSVPEDALLSGHAFNAYQIFDGDEDSGVLSNITWGRGINSDAFLTALKADATYGSLFADCGDSAAKVAEVLGANNTNIPLADAVAKLAYANKAGSGTPLTDGTNTLPDGYYLIVDNGPVTEGQAYNAALLQVVGEVNITVKTDAPSVEKKVREDDKYKGTTYGEGYNDVADYNIGDHVPFKLIGTVPDMSRYDTYKYAFHDTLSAGLTLDQDTVKVYAASDKAGTDKTEITGWTSEKSDHGLTVSFDDLKTVEGVSDGKYIIVEYTATLNSGAEVGLPGNLNEVYLTYSNNPNEAGEGKTEEDQVIVFTYELDTTKVDGQETEKTLEGAEFVLLNADQSKVAEISGGKFVKWVDDTAITKNEDGIYPEAYTLKSGTDGKFALTGLDDGTYYLKETKAPAGYNKLENPIEVVVTATTSNGQGWNDFVPGNALTHLAVTADGEAGTGNVETGAAAITVANNAGSTLPETGGIGTTIFYAVGSVLVLAAVILLVAKKRMSAKD